MPRLPSLLAGQATREASQRPASRHACAPPPLIAKGEDGGCRPNEPCALRPMTLAKKSHKGEEGGYRPQAPCALPPVIPFFYLVHHWEYGEREVLSVIHWAQLVPPLRGGGASSNYTRTTRVTEEWAKSWCPPYGGGWATKESHEYNVFSKDSGHNGCPPRGEGRGHPHHSGIQDKSGFQDKSGSQEWGRL